MQQLRGGSVQFHSFLYILKRLTVFIACAIDGDRRICAVPANNGSMRENCMANGVQCVSMSDPGEC